MITKVADSLKNKLIPYKNSIVEKYSSLRYSSAHREVKTVLSNNEDFRLTILVPTINAKNVFGGVTTALKIFKEIYSQINCDARIIVLDNFEEISPVVPKEFQTSEKFKIDIAGIENSEITVRKNEIFISTFWTTALLAENFINTQIKEFGVKETFLIYLIQDYEPGFYPWSSEYAECERTYHFPFNTIAVFNSKELNDYFYNNNYKFFKSYYFNPMLNDSLKEYLINNCQSNNNRKKQILIYGRPQEYRNAYTLVIDALDKFSEKLDKKTASEWTILSLGSNHKPVNLKNGMKVIPKGKVTLEEYAKTMLESYVAVSLMISPHPSYPPLEMSTFGIKTITNTFQNKDLSYFNENIISLNCYDAKSIAKKLFEIVNNYNGKGVICMDNEYVGTENTLNPISLVVDKIVVDLRSILNE